MDPRRAARLMDAGRLPNLARLREKGCFRPLGSTCPPMSPVAWSTFATGVNPGKHAIFDFLRRDPRTYLPELSSARIGSGPRPEVRLLRRSRPFWAILGERRVRSTILRVPITFPPEPFRGLCLAAMCTPDLRGTQGEFTLFQSDPVEGTTQGGRRIRVTPARKGGSTTVRAALPGPRAGGAEAALTVEVTWREAAAGGAARPARLRVSGRRYSLVEGRYTPWVLLSFRLGRRRVRGLARFLLLRREPEFRLYVTPLQIDPGHPALPVAHPSAFSIYLAKLLGPFATVGLAEDTWALSEGVLDDAAFVRQVRDIHAEREAMFFEMLRRTRRGVLACVFDITDRMQHMYMRPGPERAAAALAALDRFAAAAGPNDPVDAVYERCDELVGRVLRRTGPRDWLVVLSDHGFTSFDRCVHVNVWLRQQGYLTPRDPAGADDCLRNVDWSRTRAYAYGLAGICLNLRGREAQGIVAPGEEAAALRREIAAKLMALRDPATGAAAARAVYDAEAVYSGPYAGEAPDLIAGWCSGYRHSWETAIGRTDGDAVFTDNPQAWCGDHCVDRREVPGVLFSNRPVDCGDREPHLADVAPTLLSLWNVPVPSYMDGRPWTVA
jgi:predicted AlkP superfamily phosphohydrolase/phosphomutase